jgi:HSP20 family protein
MLMRLDPFRELDRLSESLLGEGARQAALPIDAYREQDTFVIQVDVPGVAPETIDLSVENSTLTIGAERKPSVGDDVERLVAERAYGTFTRQMVLADRLDTANLSASYDAGVLTIRIPVAEQAKPRRIEVKAGSAPHETTS